MTRSTGSRSKGPKFLDVVITAGRSKRSIKEPSSRVTVLLKKPGATDPGSSACRIRAYGREVQVSICHL